MHTNAIVQQQIDEEKERRAKADYRYPYRIVCVYLDADNRDFPIINEVRDYCSKNNVTFSARQYDHEKYSDDMFVNRLPAFHLYLKDGHNDIFYFDNNPIHKLQIYIWKYQDKQRAKEKARKKREEKWNAFVAGVKATFSLERFKPKPALNLEACLHVTRNEVRKNEEKNISEGSGSR